MNATREIPPSIATAIAEGKLDPITMEAFNHFSSQEEPKLTHSNGTVMSETSVESTEESCFTIFSSHETRVETVTGKFIILMQSSNNLVMFLYLVMKNLHKSIHGEDGS